MSSINTKTSSGFTLVELLVVAPIAVIVIAGLVLVMINLVGDALIAQQRNVASYETQDGLNQLEQDVRLSSAILQTSGTMASPQGSDQTTAAFTATTGTLTGSSGPALILQAYATTTNPLSASRALIYTNQPSGSCTGYTANDPLNYLIIYFVKADPDNGGALALWRRTSVPTTGTLCNGAAWQMNSCFPAITGGVCKTLDRLVVSNVSSVVVTYYFETPSGVTNASGLTSATDDPSSVRVIINTSKSVGNSAITSSMSIYASRLNG